jgi:hypothetical protein
MKLFERARQYIEKRRAQNTIIRYAKDNPIFANTLRSIHELRTVERHAPMMATGRVVADLCPVDPITGARGEWATVVDDSNLVVTQAESLMAKMAIGAANAAFAYIELGDPGPALSPALDNLTLQQSTLQRKALTTLTQSGNVVTGQAIWTTAEGNGFTYTESGLFTGPFGGGLMFARKTFNGINKTAAFELRITWYITFLVQASGSDCAGIALLGPSTVTGVTYLVSGAGGEASIASTFEFTVGANHVDVFLNGIRLAPSANYNESSSLVGPVLGGPNTKGVNFVGFTLNAGDRVLLVHRVLA